MTGGSRPGRRLTSAERARLDFLIKRQDLAHAGPTGTWAQRWLPGLCKHTDVRCTHGDEITFAWRGRRRLCLICGRALRGPIPAVCWFTGNPHLSASEGTR